MTTDSAVTAMALAAVSTDGDVHISDSDVHITVKVVATDSAVAALSVAISVTLMCTLLS